MKRSFELLSCSLTLCLSLTKLKNGFVNVPVLWCCEFSYGVVNVPVVLKTFLWPCKRFFGHDKLCGLA